MKSRKNLDDEGSILSRDFSGVEKILELWVEEREKKSQFYQAILEYIEFLEGRLADEENLYQRYLLEKEIKQLRKLREQYYVPSVLEVANYELVCRGNENKGALEGSSFSLVKRRKKEKDGAKKT